MKRVAIGYGRARNLMRQLDWKMKVVTGEDNVERCEVYHPLRPNRYKVRADSAAKLLRECRVVKRDGNTAILCYNSDGSNEDLI